MKQNECLISIVVPVYNVEKYLVRCLDSIINQSIREIEIILVDDGSTDISGDICDKYALQDERIKVIHKENGGLVSARQAGIKVASGQYIGFVDSDDWIESNMFQSLYKEAVLNNADAVAEGMLEDVEGEWKERRNKLQAAVYKTVEEREYLYQNMLSCEDFFCLGVQPYLWNKLFRRELVMKHMPYVDAQITVGEDAAAVYPMFAMAKCIVITKECHYHYCLRSTSMMLGKVREDKEYDNAFLLYDFLHKSFEKLGAMKYLEKALNRYTINNLLSRAFGRFAESEKNTILFPFSDIDEKDSLILYGAGALGKAVYNYIMDKGLTSIKAWVDKSAELYQKIGLPVRKPDEIYIEKNDKVVVAVFSKRISEEIEKSLSKKGISKNNIIWISIPENVERKILGIEDFS